MAIPEIGATLPEIGAIAAAANPRSAATMTATTTPMSTDARRRTSERCGWRVAPQTLEDPLAELGGGDIRGPAVADHAEETLFEDEVVVAVAAVGEVLGNFFALRRAELLVQKGVEALETVVAIHRHPLTSLAQWRSGPRRSRAPSRPHRAAAAGTSVRDEGVT